MGILDAPVVFARGTQLTPLDYACWGDSLTAGTGTPPGNPYPGQLQALLPAGASVYNGGVGGDTSSQILTRFQADTAHVNSTVVIWAGRNDYSSQSQVLSNVATIVAALPTPKRFLVLSVINGRLPLTEWSGGTGYAQIVALNAALAAAYPNNYLDIRSYLVSQYNAGNGLDVIDHTNDTVPHSLAATVTSAATLSSSITTTSQQAFNLTFTTGSLVNNTVIQIDSEYIYITGISGSNVTACTRGYAGSTAATHTSSTVITDWDTIHLTSTAYGLVAAQVAAWFTAHAVFPPTALGMSGLGTALSGPPPIGTLVPNVGWFAAAPLATDSRALRVNPGSSGGTSNSADQVVIEAPPNSTGTVLNILSDSSSHQAALYLGAGASAHGAGLQYTSNNLQVVSGGANVLIFTSQRLGINFSNGTAGSVDARITADDTISGLTLGSVSGNGTAAGKILRLVGQAGGATTGTSGQTAGAGADALITAGAGGAAPSGSTNGAGGNIALQAGVAGAGAGTAGANGAVKINPSGSGSLGFWGATPVAKPTVTGAKGSNAALGSLLTQLVALGLITDTTTT